MLLAVAGIAVNTQNIIAVVTVLANWHNVMRAINMASSKSAGSLACQKRLSVAAVKIPKADTEVNDRSRSTPLPQSLVRIPVEKD